MITKYPSTITSKLSIIKINDFEARQEQDSESVTSYYTEKIKLANMASPNIPDNMLVAALIKGLLPLYQQQLSGKLSTITTRALFLSIQQGIEQEMQWFSTQDQVHSRSITYPSEDRYIHPSVNTIRRQQPGLDATFLMTPCPDVQQRRPWNRYRQPYYPLQQYPQQEVVLTCYRCGQPGHLQRYCHLNKRGGQ
ncbi:unnamed protein product [Didymodactylos carnosus]|nr:unnamed protein product [Didymodactylos carnosus]CAF3753488.1 unnamed protein product [Didymodactylos carnosus]